MIRLAAMAPLVMLAACNPPAADDYVARIGVTDREAPSAPLASPDTQGAVWAPDPANPMRLVYGKPGRAVLFALRCDAGQNNTGQGNTGQSEPRLTYTRHAPADPHAKAVLALIGNGHVARLKIDAVREGSGARARWLWRGSEAAISPAFESLTGGRAVEATVPGAGSVMLNASPLTAELVDRCRAQALPASPASAPAAIDAGRTRAADTTGTAAPPPPLAR